MTNFQVSFDKTKRVAILIILMSATIAIYIFYLFYLQIIQNSVYENRADSITKRNQVIIAKRGEIFDRNYNQPIASNYDTFSLTLNPDSMDQKNIPVVIDRLSSLLSVPKEILTKKFPNSVKLFQPIEMLSNVTYPQIVNIAENIDLYPGISWQSKPIRNYGMASMTAQILGYVGEITPEELQVLYNRGYTAKDTIGKTGIEKTYDLVLRGKDGLKFRRVDAQGKGISKNQEVIIPPTVGKSLVLTIDKDIQELAVRSLGKRAGSVIVMKPATGEILAMVSYPTYDPNQFYSDQSLQSFSLLARDPASPFLNRSIQAAAPPASAFKVLMTTAVLEEHAFSKNSVVNCLGSMMIGNRKFNCHVLTGHGPVNIFDALAQSCNVFYFTMGVDHLGIDVIDDYCFKFGFGEITGIDLPGEISGNVPTPDWKQQVLKTPWVGGDTANLSIGQGFMTATPMQMANMVCMIVNNGVVYQPHLLKEIRDPITRERIQTYQHKVLRQAAFRQDTFDDVKAAMRKVIVDGTAAPVITTKAVEIAAKTGTGQTGLSDDNNHSWFVSFAPYRYQNPEDVVVVVVWVDAVNTWEWWAPKAANIILHGIFTKKNYFEAVKELHPWYMNGPETMDFDKPAEGKTP